MTRTVATVLAVFAVVALAAVFRLPQLDLRPMHADEAVHTARFRQLWLEGDYRYDPDEYHGPTLNVATLPVVWVEGLERFADTTETTYRIVPAVFGLATLLLLLLICDGQGRAATVWAALFMAVSPAMTFYSRYYIQETLFVFFTLGAIACGWRYHRSRRLAWCLAAGVFVGLMQATKETSVLAFAAMFGAIIATWLLGRRDESGERHGLWSFKHVTISSALAIFVAFFFLTTFFTNADGFADAVKTYMPWLRRAGGESPHIHPWNYYLQILMWWHRTDVPGIGERAPIWTEALIVVLAGFGLLFSLRSRRERQSAEPAWARFIGVYALLLLAIYSVIPYKTPWCVLGALNPMALAAGIGAARLIEMTRFRPLMAVAGLVLLAGVGHLGYQSYRANFVDFCSPTNPHVYAHATENTVELYDKLEELAEASPLGYEMRINVVTNDPYYWPLPWYLRKFDRQRIGYWREIPEDLGTPIVITVPEFDAQIDERLRPTHRMTGYYSLRPGKLVLLFVRDDVWESHLEP